MKKPRNPQEKPDLVAARPDKRVRGFLDEKLDDWMEKNAIQAADPSVEYDEQELKQLRELGYLG